MPVADDEDCAVLCSAGRHCEVQMHARVATLRIGVELGALHGCKRGLLGVCWHTQTVTVLALLLQLVMLHASVWALFDGD